MAPPLCCIRTAVPLIWLPSPSKGEGFPTYQHSKTFRMDRWRPRLSSNTMNPSLAQQTTLHPSDHWRLRLAWSLCGAFVTIALLGLLLWVYVQQGDWRDLIGVLYMLSCVFTGMLIITRRPTNLIGWLLLCAGLCLITGFTALQYGLYGAVIAPGSLPAPLLIAWLASIVTPWGTFLVISAIPLVFPDGRLVSPAWRPAVWVALVGTLLLTIANTMRPGTIQDVDGLPNPFALSLPAPWQELFTGVQTIGVLGLFLMGASSIVVRYRRANPATRQQLKWLMYAVVAWGVTVVFAILSDSISENLFYVADSLVLLALLFIPLTIGVAVLRYRLYDIDLLINRTLLYTALTLCITSLYAVVVIGLGTLFQAEGSPLVALIAAAFAAVLFAPLRERLQRAVNRLLYGERDEPYTALARLGQRLEGTLAPDEVLPTIVQAVREALKLPYAAIALRTSDHAPATLVAAHGEQPDEQLINLPLMYQGSEIGQLQLAPRGPGEPFSPADEQLLRDLARQAGAALYAVRLTTALQASLAETRRSREQLLIGQEEERRRIQRDLHDGLGPVLASMRMRLEACLDQAEQHAPALVAPLEQLDALIGQASSDIRRLVYNLRPPALDQLGLVGALRQHIGRFRRETGLYVEFSASEGLPLSAAAEVALYRMVQEALNNTYKHAQATSMSVELMRLGEALLLQISDNGTGGAVEGNGTGLRSLRERAELLDGTLVLHSQPGAGTTLEIYLPVREEYVTTE
jgi:signal transduction histidine kinase